MKDDRFHMWERKNSVYAASRFSNLDTFFLDLISIYAEVLHSSIVTRQVCKLWVGETKNRHLWIHFQYLLLSCLLLWTFTLPSHLVALKYYV